MHKRYYTYEAQQSYCSRALAQYLESSDLAEQQHALVGSQQLWLHTPSRVLKSRCWRECWPLRCLICSPSSWAAWCRSDICAMSLATGSCSCVGDGCWHATEVDAVDAKLAIDVRKVEDPCRPRKLDCLRQRSDQLACFSHSTVRKTNGTFCSAFPLLLRPPANESLKVRLHRRHPQRPLQRHHTQAPALLPG